MDNATRKAVRERAGNRCEYCQVHQDDSPLAVLPIEHIRPLKHGGTDELTKLALACIDCNLSKALNLTGIDPETGRITELFHPRRDLWDEHFSWQGIHIVGKTPIWQTSVQVLNMNSDDQLALRSI